MKIKIIALLVLAIFFTVSLLSCSFFYPEKEQSMQDAYINDKGELVVNYSDGTSVNLGAVKVSEGQDGVTPTVEISTDGYWVINGNKTDVIANQNKLEHDDSYFEDDDTQGLGFYLNLDGSYEVWIGTGTAQMLSHIIIPATYNGRAVTKILDSAFSQCKNLISIVIPDSITSIGDSAFAGCTNLTEVNIPDSVTTIGKAAFYGCTNLARVNIPDSVISLGNSAFVNCQNLEYNEYESALYLGNESSPFTVLMSVDKGVSSFTFSDNTKFISNKAFEKCEKLTSLVIPEGVISIGNDAFRQCEDLVSIVIPESVVNIGDYAFADCWNLTEIIIPGSVTRISNFAFFSCGSLTNVIIHEGVTSIGAYAFSGCSSLDSIVIPKSMTYIGEGVFRDCSLLSRIYYTGSVEDRKQLKIAIPDNYKLAGVVFYYDYVIPTTEDESST